MGVWPKAFPAICRGVCTAQCGFFIYIDVGHEAPPCRALRAPAGRGRVGKGGRGRRSMTASSTAHKGPLSAVPFVVLVRASLL